MIRIRVGSLRARKSEWGSPTGARETVAEVNIFGIPNMLCPKGRDKTAVRFLANALTPGN